ncbi:uncharacterized protein FOMMEDRAFT_170114 [Fomitiporia mediterranea MF3/22]|uniref:uncharacterized protein n=1 Tax=Fomitiporia mediterranea (strain MF3/22) TaxID=694068 RepID=UPI0004409CD3|nr:uncharacterized protein FOMMEDRAFT_170114 [Fomitiporia mediterranea MF3/22]EJD00057.1 hypothetical protein FOMMEDRAFT_170114 [Fomitiporia mediterranea MF3/22]
MTTLQTLPHDVHSLIWSNLDLKDVLRLRQTCSTLAEAISNDKLLWTRIFVTHVKASGLCSPHNLRSIEDVAAHDVESWVKHAVLLDKAYKKANRELSVRRLGSPTGLWVTWIKLLLGRWCLIASSNDDESVFSVWEVPSEGEPRLSTKICLDAPVLDGQVDEDNGCCRCAITVGTSTPYILILNLSRTQGTVVVHQLAEIPDASHVVFLRGSLIGFAVRSGSDKYPHILNWRTKCISTLCVPCGVLPDSTTEAPQESCVTMAIKDGYIFTLHRSAIDVFVLPDIASSTYEAGAEAEAKYVTKLPLTSGAFDGRFTAGDDEQGANDSLVFLRLHFQDFKSGLREALIFREDSTGSTSSFTVSDAPSGNHPDVPVPQTLYHYSFGVSTQMVFCMTSHANQAWIPPALSISHVQYAPGVGESSLYAKFGEYVSVQRTGLPLLYDISCLDFDDGRGIIVFGTNSGDVRFASFLESDIIPCQSLQDDLLENLECAPVTSACRNLSQVPDSLDLPVFYNIRKEYDLHDGLPSEVSEELILPWYDQAHGLEPFGNWSNDWILFQAVWDWITPLSRWGSLDIDFLNRTASTVARNRLQALGDIIPVVYDIDDHCRVIFRIGEQMFYCRSLDPHDEERANDESQVEGSIILGNLPIAYSEFLSNPNVILAHASDHATQRNLSHWHMPQSISAQASIGNIMLAFRDGEEGAPEQNLDNATMEGWSNEEWERNYQRAMNLDWFLDIAAMEGWSDEEWKRNYEQAMRFDWR